MKVLLVDDDKFILDLYERELKLGHHESKKAHDGAEALGVINNARFMPDVIITSLDMPQMNGYQLITHLKSDDRLKKIPIMVLTNRFERDARERALSSGASVYMIKSEHTAHEVIRQAKTLTNL